MYKYRLRYICAYVYVQDMYRAYLGVEVATGARGHVGTCQIESSGAENAKAYKYQYLVHTYIPTYCSYIKHPVAAHLHLHLLHLHGPNFMCGWDSDCDGGRGQGGKTAERLSSGWPIHRGWGGGATTSWSFSKAHIHSTRSNDGQGVRGGDDTYL